MLNFLTIKQMLSLNKEIETLNMKVITTFNKKMDICIRIFGYL